MTVDNRRMVQAIVEGGARSTATIVRKALDAPGAQTVEINDWFIEIDDTRTSVKIELDSVPEIRAEMSVEEFLAYADEFAAQ